MRGWDHQFYCKRYDTKKQDFLKVTQNQEMKSKKRQSFLDFQMVRTEIFSGEDSSDGTVNLNILLNFSIYIDVYPSVIL